MAFEDKVSICAKCGWEFLREPNEIIDRHVCDRCGGKFIHTNVTAEEMFLIERTSKNREFINAMIELKKMILLSINHEFLNSERKQKQTVVMINQNQNFVVQNAEVNTSQSGKEGILY